MLLADDCTKGIPVEEIRIWLYVCALCDCNESQHALSKYRGFSCLFDPATQPGSHPAVWIEQHLWLVRRHCRLPLRFVYNIHRLFSFSFCSFSCAIFLLDVRIHRIATPLFVSFDEHFCRQFSLRAHEQLPIGWKGGAAWLVVWLCHCCNMSQRALSVAAILAFMPICFVSSAGKLNFLIFYLSASFLSLLFLPWNANVFAVIAGIEKGNKKWKTQKQNLLNCTTILRVEDVNKCRVK